MELNTDALKWFENSSKPSKQEIKGEVYVTSKPNKQELILNLKNKFKIGCGAILATVVLATGATVGGTLDSSTEVLKVINTQYTYMNPFGEYVTGHVYSDEFRKAMNDLGSFELMKLFNSTSNEMYGEGLKNESKSVEDVVDRMSADYNNIKDSHK